MLLQASAKHHAVYMISSVASSLFGSVRVSSKGPFVELVTLFSRSHKKNVKRLITSAPKIQTFAGSLSQQRGGEEKFVS